MKKPRGTSGFALALTLVLMVLILIVVVAYLVSTRIERSTSSVYANRLRAKIQADSGLAAAIHLLKDNTRYGNYVTAMPAPSPSPASIYTEIYRPTDRTSRGTALNDYLQFNNAGGEVLVSLASSNTSPGPDPRPTPTMVYPSPTPATLPAFALPSPVPALSSSNSYDFNQIVTVGSATGRLVQPSPTPVPPPAYGEWVNVRDINSQIIGRYAFYIEDESMKVNVNYAGNNVGGSNMRVNDLSLPLPASTPASQIQEVDPSAILPTSANRTSADTNLINLGNPGSRLFSRLSLGLLNEWSSSSNYFPDYVHLATTLSKEDNVTARGWQRLDLNALVAAATDNASKSLLARKIADWIRDAWTSNTTLANLQYYQMFNDSRLRLQIAANIIDYIDQDNVPTDPGDVIPDGGYTAAIPVLGIEKVPYLVAVEVLYETSNSNGSTSATVRMKLQFRFLNLFDSALDLTNQIDSIEVTGVPIVTKSPKIGPIFDVSTKTYSVKVTDLKPVIGSGTTVPAGIDGQGTSGAKTFQTDWLETQNVTFVASNTKPRFSAGKLMIRVLGKNSERIDQTEIVWNQTATGYDKGSGSNSVGDFLQDVPGPYQVALISLTDSPAPGGTNVFPEYGDPRYRPPLASDRWHTITRTDKPRVDSFIDVAELNTRFGVDWYDYVGDRPLSFIRNGAMLNIGELGNISAAEYPWRTLYLQHSERPANTSQAGPATDIPLRRSQSLDYILVDLFRAGGSVSRMGAININTQQQFAETGATTLPLQCLFLGTPVGISPAQPLTESNPAPSADRVSTGVNALVTSTTVDQSSGTGTTPVNYRIASISNKRNSIVGETATADNNPTRPYLKSGELASTLSRLLSASEASDTSGSSSTSRVVYSVLRNSPQTTTENNVNYKKDYQVEQAFREVSNSITTHGNIFRVLYVGQALKNGLVNAEYLGEAFVQRDSVFAAPTSTSNTDAIGTSDSTYRIVANRVVTE